MSRNTSPLVVIGVGQVLRGDDAVGVRVVEALEAMARVDPGMLPPDTQLVDGGTLGLDLLGAVRASRGLILVDAVRLGGTVGEVRTLDGGDLIAAGRAPDGGSRAPVSELLAVARLLDWLPTQMVFVGIEVGELEPGIRLSPSVAAAVPAAVALIRRELLRMDHRIGSETQGGDPTRPLAGAMT